MWARASRDLLNLEDQVHLRRNMLYQLKINSDDTVYVTYETGENQVVGKQVDGTFKPSAAFFKMFESSTFPNDTATKIMDQYLRITHQVFGCVPDGVASEVYRKLPTILTVFESPTLNMQNIINVDPHQII